MAKKKVAVKKAVKKSTRKTISAERFVTEYAIVSKQGGTIDDIAKQLGISKQAVMQKASNYKKLGVKLPKLNKKAKLDVAALNEILNRGF